MAVITRGEREVSARFETFPERAHRKILERISGLTAQLEERVRAAAPVRTGQLRGEISDAVYNEANRVAGYVGVYAGGNTAEYAKAATLEYGTDKVRQRADRSNLLQRLTAGNRNLRMRVAKAAQIQAFRYLRDPLEQMKPEIEVAIDEAVAEAAAEGEA